MEDEQKTGGDNTPVAVLEEGEEQAVQAAAAAVFEEYEKTSTQLSAEKARHVLLLEKEEALRKRVATAKRRKTAMDVAALEGKKKKLQEKIEALKKRKEEVRQFLDSKPPWEEELNNASRLREELFLRLYNESHDLLTTWASKAQATPMAEKTNEVPLEPATWGPRDLLNAVHYWGMSLYTSYESQKYGKRPPPAIRFTRTLLACAMEVREMDSIVDDWVRHLRHNRKKAAEEKEAAEKRKREQAEREEKEREERRQKAEAEEAKDEDGEKSPKKPRVEHEKASDENTQKRETSVSSSNSSSSSSSS